MIIETSCNQLYSVVETGCDALSHLWYGLPVKKVKDQYVLTAAARRTGKAQLVRKEASKVVEA